QRVPGLCAANRHRAGGAVHTLEVDLGDEVALALDLACEAVVRLEGQYGPGLDLQRRVHFGAKAPDDLVARHDVGVHSGHGCILTVSGKGGPMARGRLVAAPLLCGTVALVLAAARADSSSPPQPALH